MVRQTKTPRKSLNVRVSRYTVVLVIELSEDNVCCFVAYARERHELHLSSRD